MTKKEREEIPSYGKEFPLDSVPALNSLLTSQDLISKILWCLHFVLYPFTQETFVEGHSPHDDLCGP